MAVDDRHFDDDEVARLLRAARPEPGAHYLEATEVRLYGPASRERRRRRPFAAALGLSGAIVGVTILASLLGAGPLAIGGQESVRAWRDCHTIAVQRLEEVGTLVRQPDGTTTVVTQDRPVAQQVERCR